MAEPTPLELDAKYDHYDFPTTAPVPQNGHAGYLTTQQQAQVHQMRLMLESEGYTKRLDTLTLVSQTATCRNLHYADRSATAAFSPRPQV